MLKHLSWQWNGVSFTCLYKAPFDPMYGAEARHIDEHIEPATPADLIACLKANPEACGKVMRGLNIVFVESIERLRKVVVLDEVCQALGVSPLAGAKAPNMVRHLVIDRLAAEKRAESAERSRDEWRAKWEDLVLHRAVCCDQMERERDEARAELEVARNPKHPDAAAWMKHLEGCDVLPGGTYAPVFLSSVSRLFTERDALKAKLAHVEGVVSAIFRDYQIEGDETLLDIVTRLANAAASRTRELEAALAKLSELEAELQPPEDIRCGTFADITHTGRRDPVKDRLEKERDGFERGLRVSQQCLADVAKERDALKAKLAEANRLKRVALDRAYAAEQRADEPGSPERDAGGFLMRECGKRCDHDSQCTLPADHLPATRHESEHGCIFYDAAQAKDSGGSGEAPCQHRKTRCENDLDVCVACGAKRMHFWGDQDDSTAVPLGPPLPPPRVDPADLTDEPITRADLEALEERIVERVARACEMAAGPSSEYEWFHALADELRRKP